MGGGKAQRSAGEWRGVRSARALALAHWDAALLVLPLLRMMCVAACVHACLSRACSRRERLLTDAVGAIETV